MEEIGPFRVFMRTRLNIKPYFLLHNLKVAEPEVGSSSISFQFIKFKTQVQLGRRYRRSFATGWPNNHGN